MNPSLAKLGHVALTTPDLDRSRWFFRDVLGLDETAEVDGTVYLRAWGEFEHHSLSLTAGPAGIDHFGWRASGADDIAAYAAQLRQAGVEVAEVEAGVEAGQGAAIRFLTPSGHPFEIYHEVEHPDAPEEIRSKLKSNVSRAHRRGASPRRIDHINVATDDVPGGMAWLGEQLGFRVREMITAGSRGMVSAWSAVTSQVHDLALTRDLGGHDGTLHHIAYLFDSREELMLGADVLREEGVSIELGPGMHGVARSMFCYVRDPGSGHRVELYTGGYHIFDPDWKPIEWTRAEIEAGLVWWGPEYTPGQGHPFDETTPCLATEPA
jgi:biphenyl-2,3-diol 1,2-dioxygenase